MAARLPTTTTRADVLSALSTLDAELHFRCLVVYAKYEELTRILTYMDRLGANRARAREAAERRQQSVREQTQGLESSIADAIRRARRIRLEMAGEEADTVQDQQRSVAQPLDHILQQAKAIKALDQPVNTEVAATADAMQLTRLEYPRRLKAALDQWEGACMDEQETQFRAAFCRKLAELVFLRDANVAGTDQKELRMQVSYAESIRRLELAFRRLRNYVEVRANAQSDAVQKAIQSPSISTVFPVYCRLKQASAVFRELRQVTTHVAQAAPSRPLLSQAAVLHRDSMLAKLRKSQRLSGEALQEPSNQVLLSSPPMHQHENLLEQLQSRWQDAQNRTLHPHTGGADAYGHLVDETILSHISNLVLSSFQSAFCDGGTPSNDAVLDLLKVIRVAESSVVFKGRRQRSAVRR